MAEPSAPAAPATAPAATPATSPDNLSFRALLRGTPPLIVACMVLAIVCMNLLANKSINTGVPWLANIPYLGYLFSSKSKSIKNSELIVVASCRWDAPREAGR